MQRISQEDAQVVLIMSTQIKRWQLIVQGQSIGHKRIVRMDALKADSLRLMVDEAVDISLIHQLAAFHVV